MIYTVDELKREIRVALDMNNSSTPLSELGDVDTLTLEDVIESKIADAARVVESIAPMPLLDTGEAFAVSIGWDSAIGYGSGHIRLPDDFLRLISFQMSDWDYAVTEAITETSPLYSRQHSRFPGIRGCPQKPVVAIIMQPIGLVMEFFSCTGGNGVYVKRARYIPIPKIEDGNIKICEKLKPAVVYYAAYMTALTIGEAEQANTLLAMSKELMGLE